MVPKAYFLIYYFLCEGIVENTLLLLIYCSILFNYCLKNKDFTWHRGRETVKEKVRLFRTNTHRLIKRKHLLFLIDNVITKQRYKYNTTISVRLSVIDINMHNPEKKMQGAPAIPDRYKIIN